MAQNGAVVQSISVQGAWPMCSLGRACGLPSGIYGGAVCTWICAQLSGACNTLAFLKRDQRGMAGQAHRSPTSTHAVHVELRQCQPENRSPGEPKKLTLEASSNWVLAVPEAGFMLALTL